MNELSKCRSEMAVCQEDFLSQIISLVNIKGEVVGDLIDFGLVFFDQ